MSLPADGCINITTAYVTTIRFYRCTMHYGNLYIVHSPKLHFLLNLEKLKFTLEYT